MSDADPGVDFDPDVDRMGANTFTTDAESLAALVAEGAVEPERLELRTAAGRVRITGTADGLRIERVE